MTQPVWLHILLLSSNWENNHLHYSDQLDFHYAHTITHIPSSSVLWASKLLVSLVISLFFFLGVFHIACFVKLSIQCITAAAKWWSSAQPKISMEQSNKNATILVIFVCMPSFSHLSKLFLKIVSSFVDGKEDKKNKVSSFSVHVWAMADLPALTGPLTRKFTRVYWQIQLILEILFLSSRNATTVVVFWWIDCCSQTRGWRISIPDTRSKFHWYEITRSFIVVAGVLYKVTFADCEVSGIRL